MSGMYTSLQKNKNVPNKNMFTSTTHTHWQMTRVMLMQTNEKPESYIIGLVDVIIVQLLIIIVFTFKWLDHSSFYNIKGTKRIEGDFNLWMNYPVIFAKC